MTDPSILMKPCKPYLAPVPEKAEGIARTTVSLNGAWTLEADGGETEFTVPCDVHTLTQLRKRGICYALSRTFTVPRDFVSGRTILRFSATNGYVRVFVNGNFVGEHINSYLAWSADITDFISDGENRIRLEFDEGADRLAHYGGGLAGDVILHYLPPKHVRSLGVETDLDAEYKDAVLRIFAEANESIPAQICLNGEEIWRGMLNAGENTVEIDVSDPLKWDAEHPNLYELALIYEGSVIKKKIGFRKVERRGNRVYVNGKEIKLRGSCRHETAPFTGCYVPEEYARKDIEAVKFANMNYIRTSHNPPSEYFLDLCDEYGVYVEDEEGIAFVARTLDYTQRDPSYENRYLSNFLELYERDRCHPSVIIWSIANESFGGMNFDAVNRLIHQKDKTRLTKFSYPMTMRETDEPTDLWSIHYQAYDNDLSFNADNCGVAGIRDSHLPVIHDEFAHVPCYNKDEQRRDPFVRARWGRDLKKFYDNIWNTEGCLGGAVWAMIDEHMLEWGVIDIYRRYKPEIYGMRRAFCPVVMVSPLAYSDGAYRMRVENRFCHTDLSECGAALVLDGKRISVKLPKCAVRQETEIVIPTDQANCAEIEFFDACGRSVAAYKQAEAAPQTSSCSMRFDENMRAGDIEIDAATGLVKPFGSVISGPYLHLTDIEVGEWKVERVINARDYVETVGGYDCSIRVKFTYTAYENGYLKVEAEILDMGSVRNPYRKKLRVGLDKGGFGEIGLYFLTEGSLDRIEWKRFGDAFRYDPDDLDKDCGFAMRESGMGKSEFRQMPLGKWTEDEKEYTLRGRYAPAHYGSRAFRALKADVDAFRMMGADAAPVCVRGCRNMRVEQTWPIARLASEMEYEGTWYLVPSRRSFGGEEAFSREKGAKIRTDFTGSGVVWFASRDVINGTAAVYLDGKLIDDHVDARVSGPEFSTSSQGDDRKYRLPVFSAENLEFGPHTLEIEVMNEAISMDCICALTSQHPVQKLIFVNRYAFPHMSWGNYTPNPILLSRGMHLTAELASSIALATPQDTLSAT